ncbi:MAG: cupin domain-containing protein [Pseudomonadota bacterium]
MTDQDLEQIKQILSGALAAKPSGGQLEEGPRQRMLANIKSRVGAHAPSGTQTIKSTDMQWEPFAEGIERSCLVPDQGDGTETCIYRLQPGAKFVNHAHTHQETCWVVSGDILVGDHPVQAGDMHIAEVGYEHPEIVARTESTLLIRSQVYTGPLMPG